MRGLADANRNQLATDVHFLTAPLRFVFGLAMWAVILLLSPLIVLAALVFGIHFMSQGRDRIDESPARRSRPVCLCPLVDHH